jgi:hypothetical protein
MARTLKSLGHFLEMSGVLGELRISITYIALCDETPKAQMHGSMVIDQIWLMGDECCKQVLCDWVHRNCFITVLAACFRALSIPRVFYH